MPELQEMQMKIKISRNIRDRPRTAVAPIRPGLTHQEWVKQKDAVLRLKRKL